MLTVLIPTYNRSAELRTALRSVFVTLGPQTGVIIGDNGRAEETRSLLEEPEFSGKAIRHLVNPAGSPYIDNLRNLIAACTTPWLSILHDDDFFVGDHAEKIHALLQDDGCDFIYSDHYISDPEGTLLEERTRENSRSYAREGVLSGEEPQLANRIAGQAVCLDGFFIRTSLAQQHDFPSGFKVYADSVWLLRVGRAARRAHYLADRLFAYRLSPDSLTERGIDKNEVLRSLVIMRQETACQKVRATLRSRIRVASFRAIKEAIKSCNPGKLLYALRHQLTSRLPK